MNKQYAQRLEEYLESECSDYDMSYSWEWNEDNQLCEAEIKNDRTGKSKIINFRYNEKNDDLLIELCEDSFRETRYFDETVKYFWMLVAPALFPEN